jgi:photosystem II stability/assembly factor-like uncharacterized protein
MKKLSVFFSLLLLAAFSFAQQPDSADYPYWMRTFVYKTAPLHEARAAFDAYWANKSLPERSNMTKQFQRMEWEMQTRSDSNGLVADYHNTWKEYFAYIAANPRNRSIEEGNNWLQTGPVIRPEANPNLGQPPGLGRVNCIAEHPTNSNILFAGTPNGGLWKTTDGGATWAPLTDDMPTLAVSWICIDPTNPNFMYMGTGDKDAYMGPVSPPYGVFKSTDGGNSWVPSNTNLGDVNSLGLSDRIVNKILIYPDSNPASSDNDVLVAATNRGIFRSDNGGIDWDLTTDEDYDFPLGATTFAPPEPAPLNFNDIIGHPNNNSIIYGTAYGMFYKSEDNGQNWSMKHGYGVGIQMLQEVNDSYKAVFEVGITNPDRVYFLLARLNHFQDFWVSQDNGITFSANSYNSALSTSPLYHPRPGSIPVDNILGYYSGGDISGQAFYDLCVAVKMCGSTETIYSGGINIWKSSNEGVSWEKLSHFSETDGNPDELPVVHADQHAFLNVGDNLYVANDGGIYYSDECINRWTDISDGLAISQIYSFSQDRNLREHLIIGTQDNGTSVFDANLTNPWQYVMEGDGTTCEIDPFDSDFKYGSASRGRFFRLNADNEIAHIFNPTTVFGSTPVLSLPFTEFLLHPTIANTMFTGHHHVFKCTNVNTVSTFINAHPIHNVSIDNIATGLYKDHIAQSPANTNLFYYSAGSSVGDRLYRCDNANAIDPTFPAINSPVFTTPGYRISDIAAHPTQQTTVYITGGNKVWQSDDYGANFTDISGDLPDVPVNCILHSGYRDNGLFIGTDIGVFYRNDNMSEWELWGEGLPVTPVTDLEIYHSNEIGETSVLRAATYGRSMWEYDLGECGHLITDIVISGTEIWTDDRKINSNIIIQPGAQLTVRGTLTFSDESRVIVQNGNGVPGGRLIVDGLSLDGGKLTTDCGLWQGVEVWGSTTESVTANQGQLQIITFGTIEKAETAVITARRNPDGSIDPNSHGGNIVVTSANFLDNVKSVVFYPYNFGVSSFSFANFNNTAYLASIGSVPETHVELNNIVNVSFSNCGFTNSTVTSGAVPLLEWGKGITCTSSRINVNNCNFSNMWMAIDGQNSVAGVLATVSNSVFTNNFRAVLLDNFANASVYGNTFNIGNQTTVQSYPPAVNDGTAYGVHLHGNDNYICSENEFNRVTTNRNKAGVIVTDGGSSNRYVKNNDFTRVYYGCIAQGINRSVSPPYSGLKFSCNNFYYCTFDISVTTGIGVSRYQGSSSMTPGNVFSSVFLTEKNLYNYTSSISHIYYAVANPSPYRVNASQNWTVNNIISLPPCTLSPPTPFGLSTASGLNTTEYYYEIELAKNNKLAKQSQLEALTDGGNTQNLLNKVNTASGSNLISVRNSLLNASPYLSEDVLTAVIENETNIPAIVTKQVLAANPHAAKSPELIQKLENRINPLPGYMLNEIMIGQNVVSPMETLQSELSDAAGKESYYRQCIIDIYSNDSIFSADSLINFLASSSNKDDCFLAAGHSLLIGKPELAQQIINNSFSGINFLSYSNENSPYLELFAVYQTLKEVNWNMALLSNETMDIIRNLADNENSFIKKYAENLLIQAGEELFVEDIYLPEENFETKSQKIANSTNHNPESGFNLYPNPANDYILIDYTANEENCTNVILEISDISNRILYSQKTDLKQGQEFIDLTNLPSGVYQLLIKSNGQVIEAKTLVIAR